MSTNKKHVFRPASEDGAQTHLQALLVWKRDVSGVLGANAGRGRANDHVWRLPRGEVLQRRSSALEDGLKECRVGGGGFVAW